MSQQQMRANHVAAGLPYMKNDITGLGNQKSPLGDNFSSAQGGYNGRSGGPPSPKTKMKLDQQHQQKLANMNQMLRMNSLSGLGYNIGIPGAQHGYPSPIARPQVGNTQIFFSSSVMS